MELFVGIGSNSVSMNVQENLLKRDSMRLKVILMESVTSCRFEESSLSILNSQVNAWPTCLKMMISATSRWSSLTSTWISWSPKYSWWKKRRTCSPCRTSCLCKLWWKKREWYRESNSLRDSWDWKSFAETWDMRCYQHTTKTPSRWWGSD